MENGSDSSTMANVSGKYDICDFNGGSILGKTKDQKISVFYFPVHNLNSSVPTRYDVYDIKVDDIVYSTRPWEDLENETHVGRVTGLESKISAEDYNTVSEIVSDIEIHYDEQVNA